MIFSGSLMAIIVDVIHNTNHTDEMKMRKAFRFRIYLNNDQEKLALQTAGCRRLIYNLCLEQRSVWGRSHRITPIDQINELPQLKKAYPFLREVPSHCLQQAVRDLDDAFKRFFKGQAHYPKHAKKIAGDTFRFPDHEQFKIRSSTIFLPKFGEVRWVKHRKIEGTPKSVTISREGNWWFASVLCEIEVNIPESGSANYGKPLGIDLGVAVPIMLSTGESISIARTPQRETRRRRKLQKQLSRQKLGSANRQKTIRRLRSLAGTQTRRRLDAAHRASAWIINHHSHVAIENLKLLNITSSAKGTATNPGRNVAQKSGLNRAILDLAHGQFRTILKQKLRAVGGTFVLIDPRNTSRRCNPCGYVSKDSRKSQAEFECVGCGHKANADFNASCNIRDLAFGLITDLPEIRKTGGLPGMACGSSGITRRKQEKRSLQIATAI